MKKLFFSFLIVLFSTLNFLSQTTAPTLSVIAAPNSQVGWIYFKNPNTVDPNTVFTVYASNFGLGANDQMQFVKNETDALGVTHTYYNHYYKNTKIDVGQNTVHSRNGKADLVTGKICLGLNMSVTPAITPSSAITYAKSYVNATTYMWEDSLAEQNLRIQKNDVTATYYPNPELIITMNGYDLAFISSNFKLAYKVDINAKVPAVAKILYIDANTGSLIKETELGFSGTPATVSPNNCAPTLALTMYSGNQLIPAYYTQNPTNLNALEYKLENPCKGGGIKTQNGSTDVYSQSATTWGPGPTIEQLVQLQFATDKYYDFLLSTFNRQSIDNNNIPLLAKLDPNGPLYIGNGVLHMPIGYGTNDMIGHEWGHAITQESILNVTPTYAEFGSINEGISDVFGTNFEFYLNGGSITNWTISEDYGVSNGGFRDLSNPLAKLQPNTYLGTYYSNPTSSFPDIHANGQVLAHWFYLLSIGTGPPPGITNSSPDPNRPNNYIFSGIGLTQSLQILYRAYPYLTNTSKFIDARKATVQAAVDLYGINCDASDAVKQAWDAVGVYDYLADLNGYITDVSGNPIPNYCIEACVTKTDKTCTPGSTGTANIVIYSTNGPYTTDWFDALGNFINTGPSITGLAAGNYFALVSDASNGSCQVSFPFTINDFSNTTLAFTTSAATCMDGTASVIASGGAYPYTYAWSPINVNVPTPTTAYIENLPAGTYNVTVTDANGCEATGNTVVGQNTINFTIPYNTAVTGMVTWNQALVTVDGQVIVAPGGHLTITGNTRVEISHHADILDPMPFGVARIIVEPGGTLTVAPTVTLTGCGGGTWDGIELWGTGIFNSGAALGNINGQIENADIGIFTSRRPKRNQAIVNNYGGSLLVNGAKFINNKVGIYMPRSSSPFSPAQQIKSSTFKIDGTSYYKNDFSLANNVEPIHIFAGNNVYVNASSNTMTGGDQYYSSTLKGTGIKCIDCNLIVDNASGPISNFTGLSIGIDNENVFSTNQIVVDGATFTNNQQGIYMQGSLLGEVKNNIFNVPSPVAPITKSYGLFAVNSNGFDISGNIINPLVADANTYGMVIENSGATGGVIFNNTYNGVGVGLQAQENNSNLKIGCNNFNNPILYSMAVVNIGANTSTLKWQGKFNFGSPDCAQSNYPAGNEWNYSGCSGTNKNMYTDAAVTFKYETHSNSNTKPTCTQISWYSANVFPNECNSLQKDGNSCISIFPLPPAPPTTSYHNYYVAIRDLIQQNKILIDTLKPRYRAAKQAEDGGNTQHLVNFINNPAKSTTQVKNKLMSSGALSDEVIVTAIERKPVALTAAALQEILATQVPLSMKVLNTVQYSAVLKDIKDQIFAANANAPTYVKAKDLAGQIANLKGDNLLLKSELQRSKLKQGKIINRGDVSNDPTERMLLSRDYATSNQPDSVRIILNQLQNDSTLEVVEKQNFISYMDAIADMLDSNQTIYTANNVIITNIQPVAATQTGMSANANTVLKERGETYHQYFIADIPTGTNQRMANVIANEDVNEKTQLANTGNFSLYPNPNNGSFRIELNDIHNTKDLTSVTISNLLGQIVLTKTINANNSLIDIQDERLFAGVYIVTLSRENKTIGQSKIIIE